MKLQTLLFTSLALTLVGCAAPPVVNCEANLSYVPTGAELQFSYLDNVPRRNREREALVANAFESLGCATSRARVARRNAHNIMCVIPGTSDREIWVSAHHDSLGSGRGVADNWTGITVLLSLARHYASEPPKHTLRLIAFADEERDLKGAHHMAQQLKSGIYPAPVALVNVDTLGIRQLAYDSGSDPWLACAARQVASAQNVDIMERRLTDMSGDWLPFKRAGIPSLHLHGLDADAMKYLHTYRDRRELVDDEKLQQAFTVIADLLALLDHHQL